jgi:D-arabinose 1-dehydrogenase-like Zn-dependent alcohol dehydrogenase
VLPIQQVSDRLRDHNAYHNFVTNGYSGISIDSQQTLAFSALTGVRPMTEVYPLEHAAEAYDRMMSGAARFRVVLTTGH